MQTSFTFARVSGIPLKFHLNWFITAGLVTWSLAGGFFPQNYPHLDAGNYWIFGAITAVLFFVSVLLHELGHAIIATREGVPVKSITLFIFGGVAQIGREPYTPGAEFRIVSAGPLTSLLLAALLYAISVYPGIGPESRGAAHYLGYINLVLALFNMIPGFPLDGGRILRAILWKVKSNFRWATRWATNVGLFIAFLFVLTGLGLALRGNYFDGLWVAFVGVYLGSAAREGYRQSLWYGRLNNFTSRWRRPAIERVVSIGPRSHSARLRSILVRIQPEDNQDLACRKIYRQE